MPLDSLIDSGQPLPAPDVQKTTLGIDLLSRYICNTWDEATGITDYLKHEGTLEMRNRWRILLHPAPPTLYDRRNEEASLDEYAKVGI